MKRIIAIISALFILLSMAGCKSVDDPAPGSDTQKDTYDAAAWIEKQIKNDSVFSFDFNGEEYESFINKWDKKTENGTDENGNPTYTLTYTGDGIKAWADITLNTKFNSVDYVCHFENTADSDSGVISNIQAMDSDIYGSDLTLTYAKGSTAVATDFERQYFDFTENNMIELATKGGRSSSACMPYFDLNGENGGAIIAIGWTGQWAASMEKKEDAVRVIAGMEETKISLYGKESMRTPSIVVMFYNTEQDEGHNQWRQLILDSYTPSKNGEKITGLNLFTNVWGSAGEKDVLNKIESLDTRNIDYDGMWMDAGWSGYHASADTYDSTWATEVGNWNVNTKIYPNTLSVVGDALNQRGKDFLLWFEPERVVLKTDLVTEHPEYCLPYASAATYTLYNLADDEATDYLIDLIDGIIKENNITWYRQDFNCEPLGKWDYNDTKMVENRVGATEIMYVTNLYRYIDTLLERNPGLIMDNCASGGQRLDIEMMKRSVPLWRTDYTVNGQESTADAVRYINMNLSYWLPLHCGGNGTDGMDDDYEFFSMMSSGLTVDCANGNAPWLSKKADQYHKCRPYMAKDFYILNTSSEGKYDRVNSAFEFYDAAEKAGYILAFRPKNSSEAEYIFKLKGLDPETVYTLDVDGTDISVEMDGASLMEIGVTATMPQARSAKLIYITAK